MGTDLRTSSSFLDLKCETGCYNLAGPCGHKQIKLQYKYVLFLKVTFRKESGFFFFYTSQLVFLFSLLHGQTLLCAV